MPQTLREEFDNLWFVVHPTTPKDSTQYKESLKMFFAGALVAYTSYRSFAVAAELIAFKDEILRMETTDGNSNSN